MGWLAAGLLMLAFNTLFGAGKLAERISDPNTRMSFAFGQAIGLSLVVGLLALLAPANRNPRSLGKVLFWTQVVALLVVVGS